MAAWLPCNIRYSKGYSSCAAHVKKHLYGKVDVVVKIWICREKKMALRGSLYIYILKIKFKVLQETGHDTNKMRVNKTEVQCTPTMHITCEIIHGRKGPQ